MIFCMMFTEFGYENAAKDNDFNNTLKLYKAP